MDMFGYGLGDDYVVANFNSDAMETVPGESVHFSDWSVTAPGTAVESWAWDFNEDGLIDSNEEDPTWTFQESGLFDVMLAVSNGASSDTLVRKNTVMVKSGVFVYEGQENGIDQSGAFIRDYLQDNGYEVVYANTFPDDLAAFDAVFATFGSAAYTSPEMSDDMANRIKNYGLQGGRIYLEGANALGRDQSGNNMLWFIFGLEDVQNGSTNMMDGLGGMEGSIMEGLEFAATDQLNQNSLDIYDIYPTATLAAVAFEESDYGPVAIQFEGTQFYGQKTFCMSYSLAQLQDGDYPSTRHEVISRILAFFDVTTNVHPPAQAHDPGALVYPNPASDQVTFSFDLMERALITTELFDLAGKKMMAADQHFQTAGKKDLHLSTRGLPPGAYLYRLLLPHRVISGKLLIER
jgi:PKD repeat protein